MKYVVPVTLLFLLLTSCVNRPSEKQELVFIRGATLLNLQDETGAYFDIPKAYIVFKENEIVDFGELLTGTPVPENARIIEADGKFIIPGLIDGFAVLNNQFYANAFLCKGVTTLIGVDGGRRGWFYPEADPSPDFYMLESVGDELKTDSSHLQDLKDLHAEGYKIALLKYKLTPEQVRLIHKEAKMLGMGTIGELGYTSYREGVEAGLDAFVHTTRYSLDVAPEAMRQAVSEQPFSNDLESPKWKYYQHLYSLDTASRELQGHASTLASGRTFLMPTISLLYADLPGHRNLWNDPVAKILNPADINNPIDKESGMHLYTKEEQENYTKVGLQEL
ncbi:MAG: hypothetical protein KAI08_14685, partial [Bacteroidales bacterium]|nr:hypothetical protein [Bacteroidales bacterium]